jgi:putative FmdB family regulatory protein
MLEKSRPTPYAFSRSERNHLQFSQLPNCNELDMPIYAYKCSSCGHARDVLQKIADAPLTMCPSCGAESFAKQLTAAGFQLKGSGWYATDFKNGTAKPNGKPAEPKPDGVAESKPAAGPAPAAPAPATACGSGGCAAC